MSMNIQRNGVDSGVQLAGVIGVGAMGEHHARVYKELSDVQLVGVNDIDTEQATHIAREYGTEQRDRANLLERVDIASVAVPTPYHYEILSECIDHGVDVLIEKPFVEDESRGERLIKRANEEGVRIQVGHIERFNPATRVLADIIPDLDIVAVDVDRLGPPLDRENGDSVVMDLMIHDIDILLALIDAEIESVSAAARDKRHATAQFRFGNGAVASLTASRLTQEKVRKLSVTAMSCRVNVDFIGQSVEIHRRSLPEYVESNGDIRYRHESVVERPMVENGEPLKAELSAFVDAVKNETEPVVTAEDGLQALAVANQIEAEAFESVLEAPPQ